MRNQFVKRFLSLALLFCLIGFSIGAHSEAFFSPDDHPSTRLIQIINSTKRRIYAAVYMLTDKQIAQALVDARKRGVDVKIIVDPASVDYEYGKGKFLKENGIDVYVFSTQKKDKKGWNNSPLMHNKFALLDNQLWTGSFNWTKSANQRNQENVILTTNKKVYSRFEKQFEILRGRATSLRSYRSNTNHKNLSNQGFWDQLRELFRI